MSRLLLLSTMAPSPIARRSGSVRLPLELLPSRPVPRLFMVVTPLLMSTSMTAELGLALEAPA
ncbi:hypothetical protein D3C83_307350 [compost metagenome]